MKGAGPGPLQVKELSGKPKRRQSGRKSSSLKRRRSRRRSTWLRSKTRFSC